MHRERLTRLRDAFARHQLDGLVVSQPESRYYLSGYTGHDLPPRDSAGYLLIAADAAILLTDPRTTQQAEREAPDFEVITYSGSARGPESVAQHARNLGLTRLGFESTHLPYVFWDALRTHGPPLVPTATIVDELRVVKDAFELEQLQEAVAVLDRCLAAVLGDIQAGQTERDLARRIEHYLLEHAHGSSFPPIVASGSNASIPHAVPTDRVIHEGEPLTIDIGARWGGYCSDMTRTVCLGRPANSKLPELHALVLEAQERVERELRPGMTGREADAIAREIITRGGYGDDFVHGLGHGIGLEVHEPPWLSRTHGDTPLESGMVFSVEPGIYLPGWGGVRIEDLVVLEDHGAHVLSQSPKSLPIAAELSLRSSL